MGAVICFGTRTAQGSTRKDEKSQESIQHAAVFTVEYHDRQHESLPLYTTTATTSTTATTAVTAVTAVTLQPSHPSTPGIIQKKKEDIVVCLRSIVPYKRQCPTPPTGWWRGQCSRRMELVQGRIGENRREDRRMCF